MRKKHRPVQPTVIRGITHTCGNDEWYIRTDGTPRCAPCQRVISARSQKKGPPRPPRKKIHPRVARAIRSTAGGRARKLGKRTIVVRAREAVPRDRQALIDAWPENELCAISGLPMLTDRKYHQHPHYAEPDRIDPDRGYVAGNVQWVRKMFNEWKNDAPLEALVTLGDWARRYLAEQEILP